MSYSARLLIQDAQTGRPDVILSGIRATAAGIEYDSVDVAVAYATNAGVQLLTERLASPQWTASSKRWLVAIDFGVTEPHALEALAVLDNSSVRIPNARTVLDDSHLRPRTPFHSKTYQFRQHAHELPHAHVVGSANLTKSALLVGTEVCVSQTWGADLTEHEAQQFEQAREIREWFDHLWARSDAFSDVIEDYKGRFTAGGPAPESRRDDETPVVTSATEPTAVAPADLIAAFSEADGLWVETHHLYGNLGAGNPGNQLDATRGSRVFFGFTSAEVPLNHHFGSVYMQVPGHAVVQRALRFGNNQMDKINLPSPGVDGPPSYDESFLLFERYGLYGAAPLFRLRVLDEQALNARRDAARISINRQMVGGRRYGLLFD